MKYKFMQIYGNCAAVHYLGPDRIKGPVDNVITKGLDLLKELFEGNYLEYIRTHTPIIKARHINFVGDSPNAYEYPIVDVVHEDPREPKYIDNLQIRFNNFKDFLNKIYTDDSYYFVYTLNQIDMNNQKHTLNKDYILNNIKYLESKKLLHKTIFVGSQPGKKGFSWWNFWTNDFIPIIKKYNLKYVEVTEMSAGRTLDYDKITANQFYKKAEKAIINKTDEKYLQYRNLGGDYMKYIIMCGGKYNNFNVLPKQFIKVNNEPVVMRTIRLLRENGVAKENIIITSNNPKFNECGVTVLNNESNTFSQDAPWKNMKGYWLDAFYPFDEPVCYLFGDVFYSKKAIQKIINTDTNDIIMFGADPAKNKNGLNMKKWEEPLGFKVVDQSKFKQGIIDVKKLFDEKKTERHPIAWELYRYLNGYDINKKKLEKNFICINDISTDVDKPEDAKTIETMLANYGEDLIKPKETKQKPKRYFSYLDLFTK